MRIPIQLTTLMLKRWLCRRRCVGLVGSRNLQGSLPIERKVSWFVPSTMRTSTQLTMSAWRRAGHDQTEAEAYKAVRRSRERCTDS